MDNTFYEIAAVLGVAVVGGIVGQWLRQPLIVMFIAVGILVGPVGLDWVTPDSELEVLAELGIAILLFLVGLKLDLHLVRTTGPVALATGLGQVTFTSGVGFLIAIGLGMGVTEALYVAIALTFSSTIIIVKLLSDKRELDELHGRIAVGFLIVQDLVVVIVMIALTAFGTGTDLPVGQEVASVVGKGAAFLAGIALVTRFVMPPLLRRVARSRELLVLLAVAWAVAVAATGDALGFSSEVGAFLAGVALASTPFREAIGARLVSLRDFLLLFFFIELGSGLELGETGARIGEAAILSAFVLIGNPIIVLVIMGLMGYRKRVSFLAGLTVAQISEFSLILVALGLSLGHIENETVGLVTLVGLITIGLSTYLILYSKPIYDRIAPALSMFERANPRPEPEREERPIDALVVGLGRYGSQVLQRLVDEGNRIVAVELDPAALGRWQHKGVEVLFGDAEDPEFVETLPLRETCSVVSTVPSVETGRTLVHGLRNAGYQGRVALTVHTEADRQRLEDLGDEVEVVLPFADGVEPVLQLVRDCRPRPPIG